MVWYAEGKPAVGSIFRNRLSSLRIAFTTKPIGEFRSTKGEEALWSSMERRRKTAARTHVESSKMRKRRRKERRRKKEEGTGACDMAVGNSCRHRPPQAPISKSDPASPRGGVLLAGEPARPGVGLLTNVERVELLFLTQVEVPFLVLNHVNLNRHSLLTALSSPFIANCQENKRKKERRKERRKKKGGRSVLC